MKRIGEILSELDWAEEVERISGRRPSSSCYYSELSAIRSRFGGGFLGGDSIVVKDGFEFADGLDTEVIWWEAGLNPEPSLTKPVAFIYPIPDARYMKTLAREYNLPVISVVHTLHNNHFEFADVVAKAWQNDNVLGLSVLKNVRGEKGKVVFTYRDMKLHNYARERK